VAEEVFLATGTARSMRALGQKPPEASSVKHAFAVGKTRVFDPDKPDDYLKSFTIRRT